MNAMFFKKNRWLFLCIFIQIFIFVVFAYDAAIICLAIDEATVNEEIDERILELLSQLDLQALQAYVDTLDGFTDGSVAERLMEYIRGDAFDYQTFWQAIFDVLFQEVKNVMPAFATIAAISLLSGLLSMLKSGTVATSSSEMIVLITYVAALIPLLSVITECFESAYGCIDGMYKQMQIVYPLLLTLLATGGATISAAVCRPTVAFFTNTIVSVVRNVVFPLTVTIIAFSIAGNLTKELKISKFSAFFKSINKWLIGICVSVFGLFFTLQGITAATHDGIVRRAMKYAIGNGVPIIGGFLSGGFDLAVAGSILIKNALGSMSIFLMVAVLFEPIILLISVSVMLRFTAAVTQPFGESRISDFLEETAGNIQYVTAGLLFTAFMYFLSILLIVFASEALV